METILILIAHLEKSYIYTSGFLARCLLSFVFYLLKQSYEKQRKDKMSDQTFHSISTSFISSGSITARTISTSELYASYLRGDGSYIENIEYSNIVGTIPPEKYGAYTIPWMAMDTYGDVNLIGNWLQDGLIAPKDLSVTTHAEIKSLNGYDMMFRYGTICSLQAPMVSSIFICTNTLNANTTFFKQQYGKIQIIESTLTQYLCTNKFDAKEINIKYAAFSTLSVGTIFFQSGIGSTMSSLTQQIGVLKTTELTTSSFTGNLNDAVTLIIQTI